ncbi:MAG: small multi-drug export protein [Endomicrobiales bacterium]|nr:small multi-drug export protein [Endomicrobiales bacterium]
MIQNIVEFLNKILADELIVMILAAAPISELRGAIPLAIGKFHFGVIKSFLLAFTGNLIPVIPLLLFLEKVSNFCMRFPIGNKFFSWWFARTRKHSELVERYEALGLILFVAIPLPITGAWTGSVAAYLLGIKFKYALPAITTGVFIAGIIVTLVTKGVLGSLTFFIK